MLTLCFTSNERFRDFRHTLFRSPTAFQKLTTIGGEAATTTKLSPRRWLPVEPGIMPQLRATDLINSQVVGGQPPLVLKKPRVGTMRPSSYDLASQLPESVLENLFCFLDLASLRSCCMVCQRWNSFLNEENSEVWRQQCVKLMSQEALQSSELLASLPSHKAKLRAFCHSWNPDDCSRNIYVKPSGFTLHRNPVAQSTDGGRGRIGFRHGRHAWEVIWEGPLGTVAVIGIATKEAPNQCHGYVALLGSNDQSWGWNLVDNHLLHNGDSQGNYPQLNNAPKYQVGERIRVILDCDENTLAFERNYEFLGVAFRGKTQRRKMSIRPILLLLF